MRSAVSPLAGKTASGGRAAGASAIDAARALLFVQPAAAATASRTPVAATRRLRGSPGPTDQPKQASIFGIIDARRVQLDGNQPLMKRSTRPRSYTIGAGGSEETNRGP